MRKLFGVEAEVNVTADEDVVRGLGKGLSKFGLNIDEIVKGLKPEIKEVLKSLIKEDKKEDKTNGK